MLTRQQLKECGACHSVFYCSTACQKRDWVSRHKPLCKKYVASRSSTKSTAYDSVFVTERSSNLVRGDG